MTVTVTVGSRPDLAMRNDNLTAEDNAFSRCSRRTPLALTVLCTAVLLLGGCEKTPSNPVAPKVQAASGVPAEPAAGTSVPSADSVLSGAPVTKTDPALGRSNSAMSAAQESAAMPMPGQNNDHSAALGQARRASAP